MSEAPTLDYERRFRSSGARLLAGIDEVGRGALAGPVSVGIAVVDLYQQTLLAAGVTPDVVLLDGSHNWLSPEAQPSLFDDGPVEPGCDAPVHTLVKADMQCLSVAAA